MQIINSKTENDKLEKKAQEIFNERKKRAEEEESKKELEVRLSMKRLDDFLEDYSQGIVTYPSGEQRNIRDEIEYSDYVLSNFHLNGYDKRAKLEQLMCNITFPVWRTVVFFTDIDTRDVLIRIRNSKLNMLTQGFFSLLNELMQVAFKETRFGSFLNDAREEASKYGKVLLKTDGNNVYVVNWYNIRAYDWQGQDDEHVRKVEEISMTFTEAREYFKESSQEVKDEIENEIEFLEKNDMDKITFIEFWDYHYIDGEYKWGKVLYLSHEYYANLQKTNPYLYKNLNLEDKESFIELERGTSGLTSNFNGELKHLDPYSELDFINPVKKICRFGFGIPTLIKAIQQDVNEKSHLKRKGDFSAYKSVWLHKRADGGDLDNQLQMSLRDGVESGALLSYGQDEELQHMTVGTPMVQFFNDYQFLEAMAMKMVGVNQLTSQEEKASKSATQAAAETQREVTSFNYFIEQQGIAFRDLLGKYAKSLLLNLKQKGILLLTGSPKKIKEIRKFLFQVHFQKNHQKLIKKFKKVTGENPWASDLDNIYKMEEAKLNKMFGDTETPINLSGFRKDIIKNLDYYFDFHITKEAFDDQKQYEMYQFLFQQAQTNPRLDASKILEKMTLTVAGNYDSDIMRTDEEMQRIADQQLQNQRRQMLQVAEAEDRQAERDKAQKRDEMEMEAEIKGVQQ